MKGNYSEWKYTYISKKLHINEGTGLAAFGDSSLGALTPERPG